MAFSSPQQVGSFRLSEGDLPSDIIELIQDLKKKIRTPRTPATSMARQRLESKYPKYTERRTQRKEHAKGDFGEASVDLALIHGWKIGDIHLIRRKWVHPRRAPARGIDIIAVTDDAVYIFEVKASGAQEISQQISQIKKFLKADEGNIQEILDEIDHVMNSDRNIGDTITKLIETNGHKSIVHSGGLVVNSSHRAGNPIKNLKAISGGSYGLIILYGKDIDTLADRFNKEVK